MLFTDDYEDSQQIADCEVTTEKDTEQDAKIAALQTSLNNLSTEVENLQTLLNNLNGKIDDKYAAQTNVLSAKVTDAINTLQNDLANKTTSAQVIADDIQTKTETVTGTIQTDALVANNVNTTDLSASSENIATSNVTNLNADVTSLQNATIYYLNAINATINSLSMTNLNADTFTSTAATISELTASVANITRLNADLITVKDSGTWHTPNSNPVNDELLKINIPAYNGIVNIVSEDGKYDFTLLNNTLVTFNESEENLYRVDFNGISEIHKAEYGTIVTDQSVSAGSYRIYYHSITLDEGITKVSFTYNGTEMSFNPQKTNQFVISGTSFSADRAIGFSYNPGTRSLQLQGINVSATVDNLVASKSLASTEGTVLYFNESFAYKEIHIGNNSYESSFSEIVDRTGIEQNIESLSGTVSATDITFGNTVFSVEVLDALPATGVKNTIYVIRNDRSYYWDDENSKFEPMSLDIDIVNGHITSGELNENLIYPAVQYVVDGSSEAFSGTFYEVTDFMTSDQIPDGAKLMYVDTDNNIKFCSTYAPYSGTKYGTTAQVAANKTWFNNISWIEGSGSTETDSLTPSTGAWNWNVTSVYRYEAYIDKSNPSSYTAPDYTPTKASFTLDGKVYEVDLTSLNSSFLNFYDSDGSLVEVSGGSLDDYTLGVKKGTTSTYESFTRYRFSVLYNNYSTVEVKPGIPTDLTMTLATSGGDYTVPLDDFTYTTPAITISDEDNHEVSVATQAVQAYVDYKQNAINNELDTRSAQNALDIAANTANIATNTTNIAANTANIATNTSNLSAEITRAKAAEKANASGITAINNAKGVANGFATLDENARLPASQLPVSAMHVVGYLDAENNHTLPDAADYDPGSEIIMISDGYYTVSTAFTLEAGKTLTDLEVTQANTLIANGYVFTLKSGDTTLGTVITFANDSVTVGDSSTGQTVISLPYASDLNATSVPPIVQVTVQTGDVVIQIGGHWVHMVNNRNVDSVNGKTGSVTLTYSDVNALAATNPTGTGSLSLNRKADTTIGDYSVAEGRLCTASGERSHAEGDLTVASGSASHTEGGSTVASGISSHAEGSDTSALSDYQHVQGKYNVTDNNDVYADIVGNGTSTSARSNASALDWNGNLRLAGDVYVGCESDSSGGTQLVSTGNIKTINGVSVVGSGDITLADLGISII